MYKTGIVDKCAITEYKLRRIRDCLFKASPKLSKAMKNWEYMAIKSILM